jgi:hypothetical protein
VNNWYDDLTDEQIEWLKSNRVPCNLLTTDEYLMLKKVPSADREYFNKDDSTWRSANGANKGQIASYWYEAHRLRPDWQRPEEKQGEWDIRGVHWRADAWHFDFLGAPIPLECAYRYNFGGIEYEEWPGSWFSLGVMKERYGNGWAPAFDIFNCTAIPATPKRVRFWRGK